MNEKKKVLQVFSLLLILGVLLLIIQIIQIEYFGSLFGITGFAILQDTVTTNSGDAHSFTHSHTVSGTNRLLVVSVALNDGTSNKTVSSVTYGSQSLNQLTELAHTRGSPRAEVWYLIAPSTGSNIVNVTLDGNVFNTNKVAIGAISYTGVDQTNPINGTTTAQGDSTSASVSVNSETNDLVQDIMASFAESSPTVGAGQTQRWNLELGGTGTSNHFGAGSTKPGAALVNMSWSLSQAEKWVMIGFNINKAPDITSPSIKIVYPENVVYSAIKSELNYTVSDDEALGSCWYTLDSGITNISITCGNNVTGLNSGEGNLTWRIYANDTSNNQNSSSITFLVDITAPNVTLTAPSGTYSSLSGIPLIFNAIDLNLNSCFYNVSISSSGEFVINNTIISGCNNTNFNVPIETTYNLYLTVNDSAGNLNSSSVTFFVDVPDVSPPGGGGGGGAPSPANITAIPTQPTFPPTPTPEETPIEGALFDIASNLIKSEIIFGEKLATKISLVNFGVPGKVNVTLDYIISDLENNTILTQQERLDVETQLEFIKTFELPSDIKLGEYKLTIKLTYSGQKEEAVSQNIFQIIPKKEKPFIYLISLKAWIIIAGIVIIVLSIILWRIRLKKVRDAEIN